MGGNEMAYRVEYLQDGDVIGIEVPGGSLAATQRAARIGMAERRSDLVRIIDVNGIEIWSETVLAS
jgi:uncharacterized protein YuzE